LGAFYIVEPKCKVCMHPQRREIDMMLALGSTRAEVRRFWNHIIEVESHGEDTNHFGKTSIENHANKHLSVHDTAVRRILERRAELEGIDVNAIEGFLLTKQGAAESLVYQGLEALAAGETVVEPREILVAIETLMKLEEKRSVVAEEVMLREIRAWSNAVKRVVPEEMWPEVVAAYKAELGEVVPAFSSIATPSMEDDVED